MLNWLRKKRNWCILPKFEETRALPTLEHMIALSDDTGIIQHAVEDIPNRSTGYCTDDVSRGFMVALAKLEIDPHNVAAKRLASTYLSFLHDAQLDCGRFHNFMSYDRVWLDAIGTHDSVGRALWSLGYGMRYAGRESWRRVSKTLFDRGLNAFDWLTYNRSKAYAMIGLAHALAAGPDEAPSGRYAGILRSLADDLKAQYLSARDADWQWFEDRMTYDNARLCEAMLRAGLALRDDEIIAIGLRTFAFYEQTTMENGVFVPIGNTGWYRRGGERARYAQQPLEAVSMVDASLAAHEATGDPAFTATAQAGLDWYYGHNSRGVSMVRGGGCADGLEHDSINLNMGAESTLSFLAAAYALAARPARSLRVAR